MTAEEYIKAYTRGCSNELAFGGYHEWLTPENALAAVELAREEMKEQMMKDAVEADIAESFTPVSESPNIYMHGFTCVYEEKESTPYVVAPCKVKLIIIKD